MIGGKSSTESPRNLLLAFGVAFGVAAVPTAQYISSMVAGIAASDEPAWAGMVLKMAIVFAAFVALEAIWLTVREAMRHHDRNPVFAVILRIPRAIRRTSNGLTALVGGLALGFLLATTALAFLTN